MKVSYNWLREYLPVEIPATELADMLTGLGLEVSSIETTESIKGGLKGVVAGKVLTCGKHPNADRLSLTTVDIGDGMPLQIVCGAPNVAVDQTVWVATVGTELFPAGSDKSLKIAKAKVRGETSEGMICAADELGLGDDHSGILVLPDDIKAGTTAAQYYNVTFDEVIEVELTPNRSDAICHIGVARDLAAWLAMHAGEVTLHLPDVPENIEPTAKVPVTVEVKNTEACPRYCGLTLTDLTIAPSPEWLQAKLRAVGVKPINNVVDVTNFVLHEMGQPLHAFDMDRISGGQIIVQTLPQDTPFVTLDGTERKLSSEDLMICDGENKGMCIGGVYGGLGSGITTSSTSIFLESAHFNAGWIRRTSMRHDLRTDAARTFEKSTDPAICRTALLRAAAMMIELAGGKVASEVIDIYPEKIAPAQVEVRFAKISGIIGMDIPAEEVRRILGALDMAILKESEDGLLVEVPTNKSDVRREADVIEEILRIYGYDHVPLKPRLEISLLTSEKHTIGGLREEISRFLAARGFLEMMGLSLVESRDFDAGPLEISPENRVLIDNTSNAHLDMMRHNLLTTTLEAVRFNQNRMQQDLMLFEAGRTYTRHKNGISEQDRLSLCLSGNPEGSGWRSKTGNADFFTLKKYVHLVLGHLGITDFVPVQAEESQWEYGQTYEANDKEICSMGSVHPKLLDQYDLRQPVYFADFNLATMREILRDQTVEVAEISKYPPVHRDVAIIVSSEVPFGQIEQAARAGGGKLMTHLDLFDIYEKADVLGEGKRSYALSVTFQDKTRTLTDEDIQSAVKKVLKSLEKEVGAVLR